MDITSRPKRENSQKYLPLYTPAVIACGHHKSSCLVAAIQLSLGGAFKNKKKQNKMDDSCPEGPEYSTIVTFRGTCYNGRHYFFARAVLILELILFQLLNGVGEGTFQISCYNSG